jgi:hypothetical protein
MSANETLQVTNPYTGSEPYRAEMLPNISLTSRAADLAELDAVFYPKPTDAYLDVRIILLFTLTALYVFPRLTALVARRLCSAELNPLRRSQNHRSLPTSHRISRG